MVSSWFLLSDEHDYVGLGRLADGASEQFWEMQDGRALPLSAVTHWTRLLAANRFSQGARDLELWDEDGYPSAGAVELLRGWPWTDKSGWFELATQLWHFKDYASRVETPEGTEYHLSTAGWSGNEAVIAAMKSHHLLWDTTWKQSRSGGHHVFFVKAETDDDRDEG